MLSDIDYVKVGRRIRAVREEHNLTQDALATQCGCARNHLSSVENGKSRPSLELLVKIASILDSSIDYFLIDNPNVNTKYIVDTHIARQLYRCTGQELSIINMAIEELLKYRNTLLTTAPNNDAVEYFQNTVEMDQAITHLVDGLHNSDNPEEILQETLIAVTDFYDGDWAGILEADLTMKIWSTYWWYNKRTGGMTPNNFQDLEDGEYLGRWIESMTQGTPMIIEDVESLKEISPVEYH